MKTENSKIANSRVYDLEERTAKFGENLILLCKKLKQDTITRPLISQLIRSGTSIGANYMEANGASSKKDFVNKIFIFKKEARETKYWLRQISKCEPLVKEKADNLYKEAHELTLIFSKIAISSRNKN